MKRLIHYENLKGEANHGYSLSRTYSIILLIPIQNTWPTGTMATTVTITMGLNLTGSLRLGIAAQRGL